MEAEVFGVVADEHIAVAAHRRQSMALIIFSPSVYRNATLTGGAPIADRDPVLGAPSVDVMVQVPAGDTLSPLADHDPVLVAQSVNVMVQVHEGDTLSPAASFPGAAELMVAGPSAMQTTIIVREVEVGPGITVGYHSLDDYMFIMSLPVIEED